MSINPALWSGAAKITIAAAQVPATQTDYTVILTEDNFPSFMLDLDGGRGFDSTGKDLRFASDVGGATEYAFNIVAISLNNNPALSTILVHVKIPSLSSAVDNTFVAFSGNSSASAYGVSDTFGQYNTYDSNIKAWLPLQEAASATADGYKDRTTNQNHGRGGNGTAGYVPADGTPLFGTNCPDFDGTDDVIQVTDDASLDPTTKYSYEAVVYPDDKQAAVGIIWRKAAQTGIEGHDSGSNLYLFGDDAGNPNSILYTRPYTGAFEMSGATGVSDVAVADWAYVHCDFDKDTNLRVGAEGANLDTDAAAGNSVVAENADGTIGRFISLNGKFNGRIQMVILHIGVARDDNYYTVRKNNIRDFAGFAAPEEIEIFIPQVMFF